MALNRKARSEAYVRKMRAELEAVQKKGVQMSGNAFSSVLFVKGEPGPAELEGGALLSGADGKALRAALLKLGYAPEDWAAVDGGASPRLFRHVVATLDPTTLVACDDKAAALVRDAFADDLSTLPSLDDAMLVPGRVVRVAGMRILNLGGFEAALSSSAQKQIMWARLKRIPPLGEPY